MTRSLIALWSTLIAAILTITVLSQFWLSQRRQSAQQRVAEFLGQRLLPFDDAIARVVRDYSIDLQRQMQLCNLHDPSSCVGLTRSPLVGTLVVVDSDSRLVFPTDFSNANADRQALIAEAQQMLKEMADPRPAARQSADTQQAAEEPKPQSANYLDQFGWITWYHRRGMVLGFWWKQGTDRRALVTIPRGRWMADIVAALPDSGGQASIRLSEAKATRTEALQQLIDVEGNVIYQWGDLPSELWSEVSQRPADAVISVSQPLEGWRLRIYAADAFRQALAGENAVLPLWLAVAGISLALVLSGILATSSLKRQLRLAAQRVSFVNQVSHELRTPLTNICLYADLVSDSLDSESDEDAPNRQRMAVIQSESQRLGRLISNVLQYARDESHPSDLRIRAAVVDDIVRDVLTAFEPRLHAVGFTVSQQLSASDVRCVDPDVVEQILVNLISNAEKYAASGKRLEVETQQTLEHVDIWVRDQGPGVAAKMKDKVFLPFVRASDRLDAPAGTGIGLTIARALSRKHGGDCRLLPSPIGAVFHCRLHAPAAAESPTK